MTCITRIANKRILAKYFLYSLQINYLQWKHIASRSIFSCYATIIGEKRPWMIELMFHLPLCDINKMTYRSLLCVFLAVLLGCSYSQELRQETGETIMVWDLCGKLDWFVSWKIFVVLIGSNDLMHYPLSCHPMSQHYIAWIPFTEKDHNYGQQTPSLMLMVSN